MDKWVDKVKEKISPDFYSLQLHLKDVVEKSDMHYLELSGCALAVAITLNSRWLYDLILPEMSAVGKFDGIVPYEERKAAISACALTYCTDATLPLNSSEKRLEAYMLSSYLANNRYPEHDITSLSKDEYQSIVKLVGVVSAIAMIGISN